MKKVAIIGAGASGLFCAIACARKQFNVDIYEQNSKCAKKILVSGNGRCNIINTSYSQNDYFGENTSFVTYALKNFSFNEFVKFTSSIGLELDIKDDGKVYPLSNEAKSVASLLENTARNLGVCFHTDSKITDLKNLMQKYDAVVVATGSEAASHLGGNKDAQEFASVFGHTVVPTYPSLVQLVLEGNTHEKMHGTKVDGEVTLFINNKASRSVSGDILFTAYGVSGFAILDISQMASQALLEYQVVDLSLNLLPKYSAQKLSNYLMQLAEKNPTLLVTDALHGLLPIKILKAIVHELVFSPTMTLSQLTTKDSKKIANQILNWKFQVKDTHGFRHAEVSGGGVNTLEINPKTMESLKQKNLYFIGEALDIVGRRGGFNFAWAWASAHACAQGI